MQFSGCGGYKKKQECTLRSIVNMLNKINALQSLLDKDLFSVTTY
jgi:hypothetical protein